MLLYTCHWRRLGPAEVLRSWGTHCSTKALGAEQPPYIQLEGLGGLGFRALFAKLLPEQGALQSTAMFQGVDASDAAHSVAEHSLTSRVLQGGSGLRDFGVLGFRGDSRGDRA